ncbi:hypothetical protein TRFO_29505 [Tritrichomonas foetus]|uniref:Uncharacterized protein n=1 Tax=Tritrichomonas foetus TaxID=1144522 RepID=A0A1J4K093_9EUKA|nr:hypothetical protein TRFO_29505 [Tritrichomonas foetus]|eukprot:OHT03196.1 hypothetical protein TRFO_29505 [Tritrichomonas foetus]
MMKELNKSLGKKRRETSIQTTFKRTEIINSFKELMKEGGNPDIEELARKYDIDLESLKARIDGNDSIRDGKESVNSKESTTSSLPPL